MHNEMLSHEVNTLLTKITRREQQILKLAFGLNGHIRLENEDIAQEMDLSKERIRQLIKKTITKLSKDPELIKLRQYVY